MTGTHLDTEVKLWHLLLKTAPSDDRRRNVSHEAASEWTDEGFAEYLLPLVRRKWVLVILGAGVSSKTT